MYKKISNYIHKSPHRNFLERYVSVFLPTLEGKILDVGSKNRRYDYLLHTTPVSIDMVENTSHNVIVGDVNNLSFEDKSFDNVICIEVLEYVSTPEIAIRELSRVLRKDGTLVLSVPFMYKEHNDMLRYTKGYLEKTMSEYFSSVKFFPLGNKYTIILDIIKDSINKIPFKLIRYCFVGVYLPFALVMEVIKSPNKNGFTSGYFVVAKK